jgi:SAM-dependent methyltransferase
MTFRVRATCRLCDASLPQTPSLKLNSTPLANEFLSEAQRVALSDGKQELFPLALYTCSKCGHVQLPVVVSPSRLFEDYVYVAGTSPVFVDHFRRYAEAMIAKFELRPKDVVVDIGSNDGTLLRFFKEAGMSVVGVDPARAIAQRASDSGIPTLTCFFGRATVESILAKFPAGTHASIVTANNVFAHADDLHDIVEGVKALIGKRGAFVLEVSYLVDVCEKTLFDTIYHEHLSYHTVQALIPFFRNHGMCLFDAERIDTHGGSLRGYARLGDADEASAGYTRVRDLVEHEKRMGLSADSDHALQELMAKINSLEGKLTGRLRDLKKAGKQIAAFGAPAKATTLMYQFKLGADIVAFVIDDSPLKQGLFTQGTHIEVVTSDALYSRKPDYTVILAWNFADAIIKKHQAYLKQGGTFVVPIPEYREVSDT